MNKPIVLDDDNCFACGSKNKVGLKLKFKLNQKEGLATTQTIIADHFNGWKGSVHGGIITTLLDEVMVYACTSSGWFTVTGSIEVKFHKPVPTNKLITVKGKIIENRGRSILTSATIEIDNKILASAKAKLIPIRYEDDAIKQISERLV